MTQDQKGTGTLVIYGVFCAAMLGVYAWSCWLGHRRLQQLNDRLIADARSAEERYEPLLRPVPPPRPRRTRPSRAKAPEVVADDEV